MSTDIQYTSDIPLKRCTKCRRELPMNPDHFNRDKSKKTGFTSQCKECHGGEFSVPQREVPDGYKLCIKCRNEYPLTKEYWYTGRYETYVSPCKECRGLAFGSKEILPDGERRCSVCKKIFPCTSKFFHRNKHAKYGLTHTCKKCAIKKAGEWAGKNRVQSRALIRKGAHVRRMKKRELPATLTTEQWNYCLRYWYGCCAYCGAQQSLWNVIEQDHFIAVSSGGGYTAENIIPACRSCNSSKNNHDSKTWLIDKFSKRKATKILRRISDYFESLDKL